jgi:hypothetical protein
VRAHPVGPGFRLIKATVPSPNLSHHCNQRTGATSPALTLVILLIFQFGGFGGRFGSYRYGHGAFGGPLAQHPREAYRQQCRRFRPAARVTPGNRDQLCRRICDMADKQNCSRLRVDDSEKERAIG